jgi:hypothetical protein
MLLLGRNAAASRWIGVVMSERCSNYVATPIWRGDHLQQKDWAEDTKKREKANHAIAIGSLSSISLQGRRRKEFR